MRKLKRGPKSESEKGTKDNQIMNQKGTKQGSKAVLIEENFVLNFLIFLNLFSRIFFLPDFLDSFPKYR